MKFFAIAAAIAGMAVLTSGCASTGSKKLTHKDKAFLLVQIARGAIAENDPTGALENLIRAESEDDSLPELYHVRALAYFAKRDPATALVNARKAVKMAPDYSDAACTLGKLLLDKGSLDEAIPHLSRAANDPLYRDSFKPLTSLGIIHYRKGEMTAAREYFDRAIQANPVGACVAYYYRGQVQSKTARLPDAIRDYQLATHRVCEGFPDAHLALGMAFEQSKQYAAARKKYLEIEQRYPRTKAADEAVNHLRYLP